MENLSISDPPPGQQQQQQPLPGGSPMPPGAHPAAAPPPPPMAAVPQLPPQMFTTAAQLLDLTDKKLAVILRDGRKLIGVLRSWDQFANIVLQSTIERIYAPFPSKTQPAADHADDAAAVAAPSGARGLFADVERGLFIVRGENVLLLGEIDLDKDDDPPPGYERGELDEVKRIAAEGRATDQSKDKTRLRGLAKHGFEGENLGEFTL